MRNYYFKSHIYDDTYLKVEAESEEEAWEFLNRFEMDTRCSLSDYTDEDIKKMKGPVKIMSFNCCRKPEGE